MGNRVLKELGWAVVMAVAIFVGLLVIDLVFEGHPLWGEEVTVAILVPAVYVGYRILRPRRQKG
jgi:hypothetical protein